MSALSRLTCSRCGLTSPSGTRFCPRCGEAVDPALVDELRWLYAALNDLEQRIARGEGEQAVTSLRDEYRARFLALRTPPAPVATQATQASAANATDRSTPVQPIAQPARTRHSAPTVVAQPVSFSWQAFLADQAIALMAYLGGFLLLVATLSFEVGAWQITSDQQLDNQLKLAIVALVYFAFGVLGVALRRIEHLRTVGRAYLGVFALMTPLVALAAYIFELRSLGVPIAGMLCISALYAAVIYLALAQRTGFATYAYFGWAAFLVGALSIVSWATVPSEWSAVALGAVSCVLLVPHAAPRLRDEQVLAKPALHLSLLTSPAAALFAFILFIGDWTAIAQQSAPPYGTLALAVAACLLVPLALGWSLTLRTLPRVVPPMLLDAFDLLVSAMAVLAALSLAVFAGAQLPTLASLVAGLALVELAAALVLGWRLPGRARLRRGMEGFALALASVATLVVLFAPAPNWPLLSDLAAGAVIATTLAIRERAPSWILTCGPFILLACARVAADLRQCVSSDPSVERLYALRPELLLNSSLFALAALMLAASGLLLALPPRTRDYSAPLYVVALAAALTATVLLPFGAQAGGDYIMPQPEYQTAILALFLLTTLAIGARAQRAIAADLCALFFGLLLSLPYARSADGRADSALALALALLALLVRVVLGRRPALALYAVALAATAVSAIHATIPGVTTASESYLGIAFAAWELLIVAALAQVAALYEGRAASSFVAGLLALGAVYLTPDALAGVALVFALVATGAAFAFIKGRSWSLAWYGAAALGSLLAVPGIRERIPNGAYWQVGVLLTLGLLAYLLSAQQRAPQGTALAAVYGIWAAMAFPEPHALSATLAFSLLIALLAAVLRLSIGRDWALALDALAIAATLATIARVTPYDAGTVETLLLIFVAIACGLAAIERSPVAGIVPCAYAIWAVIVEPSTHTLLLFALAAAAVAVALGRVVGARWSLPWYLVAAVAGLATGLRGTADPRFEALALLALALAAYSIAAVESMPDLLPLAYLLGALALGAAAHWAQFLPWQTVLAYVTLSYVYFVGRWLWQAIPWLRARDASTAQRTAGATLGVALATALRHDDPRAHGAAMHVAGGFVLALATVGVAMVTLDSFSPSSADTQVIAVALLATGALFAASAWLDGWRAGWYAAGELLALAITWQARWLGADNLQYYVLAPASYHLLIGALLPNDKRVRLAATLGRWASLTGALLLLVPSFYQAFSSGQELVYGTIMTLEALVVVLIGLGLRMRVLVMVGAAFVAIGAIRGAMLAISDGAPIALIIGAVALLLIGAATWLSLRARRDA